MKKILFFLAALLLPAMAAAQSIVTAGSGKPVMTGNGNPVTTAALASRVSLVATGNRLPNALFSTASEACMTRKGHYNRSSSTRFQGVYPCWYHGESNNNIAGMELGPGNACSVKAWIEYPAGTYTQITFGGSTSAEVIANATTQTSDFMTVSIPPNAKFWTWTYITGSGGNNFPYYSNAPGKTGDALHYTSGSTLGDEAAVCGTTGVPASPSGTMIDNNNGKRGYWEAAILGDTTLPTFALIGDSRTDGTNDVADASYDTGNLARSVGPTAAYINMGISGDRMAGYFASHTLRDALIATVNPSAIIDELGVNEFNQESASTSAWENVAKNHMAHMVNTFPSIPIYRATMEPWTTTTDFYATPVPQNWGVNCGNQTSTSYDSTITTENDHIRSNSFDSIPYVELSDPVSTARDSGCWKANGTLNYYTNGGHESQFGNYLIEASGNINPRSIAATAPLGFYSYPSITLTGIASPSYATGYFSGTQAVSITANQVASYAGISPGVPLATGECWVYVGSIGSNASSPCFFGGQAIYIAGTTGYVGVGVGNGTKTYGTTAITTGAWHHLELDIGTQASGGNVYYTVFLDGTQAAQYNFSTSSTQWTDVAGDGIGSQYFTGYVSELAVWNYVRHTSNFTPPSSPYAGTESGLVGLWHLNGSLAGVRGPAAQ